jgi:hypothetical protein
MTMSHCITITDHIHLYTVLTLLLTHTLETMMIMSYCIIIISYNYVLQPTPSS